MSQISWAKPVSGDFSNSLHWTGGVIPGAADDAVIDPVGDYTVTIDDAESVHSLTLSASGATVVADGALTIGSTLAVTAGSIRLDQAGRINGGTLSASGGDFIWHGGTISNAIYDGPLELTTFSAYLLDGGGFTVGGADGEGPGTIDITGSRAALDLAGGTTLDNVSVNIGSAEFSPTLYFGSSSENNQDVTLGAHTKVIQVARKASLRSLGAALINDGVISAGVAGGRFSFVYLPLENNGSIICSNHDLMTFDYPPQCNHGLIESDSSATILISDSTIDGGSSGTIAADGGLIRLVDERIEGGTLTSAGSGRIRIASVYRTKNFLDGTASAVKSSARLIVDNGAALTIEGVIVNSGTVTVNGTTAATSLTVGAAGVTLSGGGTIVISRFAGNRIDGGTTASALTNVDDKISGAGVIGDANLTLINGAGGIINGNLGAGLTIDTGANTIQNAGKIAAGAAGGATVKSAVHNTGLLWAGLADFTVDGAVTGSGTAWVNAARLDFRSTFGENVAFGANLAAIAVLELADSQGYGGTLTGFSKTGGSALDLDDIAFNGSTTATYAGTTASGVLTVSDGAHAANIHLMGNYTKSAFIVSSDGHGGTSVSDPAAAGSALRFVTAAAGFRVRPAGATVSLAHAADARASILAKPGATMA